MSNSIGIGRDSMIHDENFNCAFLNFQTQNWKNGKIKGTGVKLSA